MRRSSDAVIERSGTHTLLIVEQLITDAVADANDDRVAQLDRVLQNVENIITAARGSPSQRRLTS